MKSREEQKKDIFERLKTQDEIQAQTRRVVEEQEKQKAVEAADDIDEDFLRECEEEYFMSLGRVRYVSSSGRVHWLTPEQIERRARSKVAIDKKQKGVYYGFTEASDGAWVQWGFNLGVVIFGVIIVLFFFR